MNFKNLLALTGKDPRPDEDFDSEELEAGIEVELEHTDDREIAKVICKTHLQEDSN